MSEFENNKIAVTHTEISHIESYIQEKNTAVLTIMFTDIKGFTELTEQKGEQYATEFRKQHDAILKQIIEADKAGLIIKFIGDAVMAVFSEPSMAVERALNIQQALHEFNQQQQTLEPIRVRIGLHMGQVSIANSLQADVFGRHVNRASRIESLADAGQIYLSYSVFDSAKGWLKNNTNLLWQSHGFYLLKGINEPVEIYEVIAKQHGKPKAPLHGKKLQSFKWLYISVLILVTALITAAIFYYQKTEVYLVRPYAENLYLDQQPISLTGQTSDSSRRILNELSIGKHIVHYEVTKSLRYYAEMPVQQGINTIELKFSELRLPSLLNRLDLPTEKTATKTERFNYSLYGKNAEKIPFTAQLTIVLNSSPDTEAPNFIHDKYQGELIINDKKYEIKPYVFGHQLSDQQAQRSEPILIYQDNYHAYYYKYYVYKTTFEFEIYAVFKN